MLRRFVSREVDVAAAGKLKIHELGSLKVPSLGKRRVRVYVPTRAPAEGQRHALVMLDGQNVFTDEGSFAGGWYGHEAVERLSPRTMHVPVIVAIDNGGQKRVDEMAAWRDGERGSGGQGELFVNWIADFVMPRIEKQFGTVAGAQGTVICGSSMGGLCSLYAHYARPDAFGGCIAMSSAFFWAKNRLFDFIQKRRRPNPSRIYIDCGEREGRLMASTLEMNQLLKRVGYGPSNLMVKADPRGKHHESAWRRRLPAALRFVFARQ